MASARRKSASRYPDQTVLGELSPNHKEVLREDRLEKFELYQGVIWRELIGLSVNLKILEELRAFPFKHIQPPEKLTFWSRTQDALYESCVMGIWRIAIDTSGDSLTIRHFKNFVVKSFDDHEAAQQARLSLKVRLKEIGFEEKVGAIRETIELLRHRFLAHFDLDHVTGSIDFKVPPLPIGRVIEIRDVIVEVFQALCFDHYFVMYPSQYAPEATIGGKPIRRDIDELLDVYASDNWLVNQAETNPEIWQLTRGQLSDDKIQAINELRRRLGKAEI